MAKSKNEKISESMKGNSNAEKYTLKDALDIFEKVIDKTREKTDYLVSGSVVEGSLCHFIGEAFDEAGTTIDIARHLRDRFNLNDLYNRIKRKCERNCYTDAKRGIIIPSMAIINLKSNHNWTDRVENNNNNNNINLTPLSEEERQRLKDLRGKLDEDY